MKALAKPSISAWAVNQLYWNHREAFDQLIASGERFHKAQTSGKIADMRVALDARREVLSELSRSRSFGAARCRVTIHRPTPSTASQLLSKAMSVYASRSDGPRPGRLTHDVDPPGFESFGSFDPAPEVSATRGAGGSAIAKGKQMHPPAIAGGNRPHDKNARRKVATHQRRSSG